MMVKKLMLPFLSLLFFPSLLIAQNFGGNPASLKWQQINTATSRVIFPVGLDSQANRISNIVQLLNNTTMPTIGNKQRKWNIVLLNQTTIPNAYVRLAPVMSELNMVPGQNSFSNGSVRWDDNLIIHENRHMQQFANFNTGLTKAFSFVLGQQGQLLANGIAIPNYFFEGDAVWQETLVSAQGRGRLPNFYNGFRALAIAKKNYSWMKIRSGSLKDYTPDHYDLGYQLVAYGNEKYGNDFWRKVTTDAVKFKGLFFAFSKAIERYSGKTYHQFRQDALDYFKVQTMAKSQPASEPAYITKIKRNTVADYFFPAFIHDDTIIVTKQSYKKASAFYLIIKGAEKKLRTTNVVIDNYFNYCNGKVVYTSYQSDPRWANRNYSNIQLLDIYTKKQRQLTFKSKYFSPVFNNNGMEILAVNVKANGANNLHRINTQTGSLIKELPNAYNYFFTQSKYIDSNTAIAAVRNPAGEMALVKVDLDNGKTETITPFSFNIVGNPFVKGDTVYYTAMDNSTPSDKIFAVDLKDKKVYKLTNNINGIYQPAADSKGNLLYSAFTADGYRLATMKAAQIKWIPIKATTLVDVAFIGASNALLKNGAGALYTLRDTAHAITKYRKSFQLFSFHSWRPVVSEPDYGYALFSDNILTSFTNTLTYTHNRTDGSNTLGFDAAYAGWFPVLSIGAEKGFNRKADTAIGKPVEFNSNKIYGTINIPLSFVGGTTSKYVNFGVSYTSEKQYYRDIEKNEFINTAITYGTAFLSFSNASRQAIQNINPRWAQSLSLNYRDAFNFRKSHKLVGAASLYFPGLAINHSLVIDGAYQTRDTLQELFGNNFSYSRGYDGLSTRRMYKLGANYHFPLFYPDWGFGNIIFFQRVRANVFYDHTIATARFNDGSLRNIKNRSAGAELYFDTKIWNELQATIGIRFSHLMDVNLRSPSVTNRWEIIIPISLIPK